MLEILAPLNLIILCPHLLVGTTNIRLPPIWETFPLLLASNLDVTYMSFNLHGIRENVIWHAIMSQMLFSQIQGRSAWIGLWRQFLPTTFGCINKMLVTCASDNKRISVFISWMLCSSLLFQTFLIAIKNIHDMKTLILYLWTCAHTKSISNTILFPKLKCTPED